MPRPILLSDVCCRFMRFVTVLSERNWWDCVNVNQGTSGSKVLMTAETKRDLQACPGSFFAHTSVLLNWPLNGKYEVSNSHSCFVQASTRFQWSSFSRGTGFPSHLNFSPVPGQIEGPWRRPRPWLIQSILLNSKACCGSRLCTHICCFAKCNFTFVKLHFCCWNTTVHVRSRFWIQLGRRLL